MNEQEYIRRVQALKERLYRTARLCLSGETAAIDAVDEAVYKGFLSCRKLRQPEYFDTWITRILINECHNELRRRKRLVPLEELPETAAEDFDSLPLKQALARLPGELRDVIVLRFFSGCTVEETAKVLKIPYGTAATRQRRALRLLRLELSEEVPE